MQKILTLCVLLSPLLILSSPVLPQTPSTKQRALALTHVTVIDTSGAPAEQTMQELLLAASGSAFAKQQRSAEAGEGKIAFDSDRSGAYDIYVINPGGSHEQQLTRAVKDEINVGPAAWSPDCRQIVFTKIWTKPKHRSQLYIMAADGAEIHPLGRPPAGASDWSAAWSPDGKELAFVSDRDGTPDIYTMRTDGSGVRRLTESNGQGSWSLNPAWSPSGDAIAFDSNRTGIEEIYVLTIGSGQVQQLTHTASKGARCRTCEGNWTAAWNPQGKKISFSSNRDAIPGKLKDPSQWGIYVMNADGSGLHRLTYWDDAHAKWSPDGKRILFESSRDGRKDDGLYVMNADGTSVQLITMSQSSSRHADWCRSDLPNESAQ